MTAYQDDPERNECPDCGADHSADFDPPDLETLRRIEVRVLLRTGRGRMQREDVVNAIAMQGPN